MAQYFGIPKNYLKSFLKFKDNVIPVKIPKEFSLQIDPLIFKFMWKFRGSVTTMANLKRKKTTTTIHKQSWLFYTTGNEDIITTIMKPVWSRGETRQIQQEREFRNGPTACGHLIYDKVDTSTAAKTVSFPVNCSGLTESTCRKKN